MIRKVRELGDQDHFNDEFSDAEKNFTYFVPANSAWDKIEWSFVSAYKILFTGLFPLQVHSTECDRCDISAFLIPSLESNDSGTTLEGLRTNEHDGTGVRDEKERWRSNAARNGDAEIRRKGGR